MDGQRNRKNSERKKIKLSEFICKVDTAGKAFCTLCESLIGYGGRGINSIIEHCTTSKKHVEKVKTKCTNFSLDYLMDKKQDSSLSRPACYSTTSTKNDDAFKPMVPMMDRVSNAEVNVTSIRLLPIFSLSFSMHSF